MAEGGADNGQKEARAMLDAFASVGATQFDLSFRGALARNLMRSACGALSRKQFASRRRSKAYRHARRGQRAFAA